MEEIEFKTSLGGIKWWAIWDTTQTPFYTVYKYVGQKKETFVFQEHKSKMWLMLSKSHLDFFIASQKLKPFCLDFKTIREAAVQNG